MVRIQGWLAVLLLAASPTSLLATEPLIGDYVVVVEGATTYSCDEIAKELATDIEIAHAASREASLDTLKALLVDKARQGYLHDGFADVAIQAADDEDRLVLQIVEGPRFAIGAVKIEGTSAIDASDLRDAWPEGKPARLSAIMQQHLEKRTNTLFENCGYYRARVSVTPVLHRHDHTADLVIDVHLDAPLRAADLEITGDDRLTRDMVLSFLGLDGNTVLTKEVRTRIEQALRDSGRFTSVKMESLDYDNDSRPASLRIALTPYDKAPPLNEPLSREQAALVKMAVWVRSFEQGDDDLTLKAKLETITAEAVASPRFGVLGWIRGFPFGKDRIEPAPSFDLAFVESEGEVGIYSFRRKRRLTAAPVPARFVTNMELVLANGPPQLDGVGQILFGAGLKTYSKRDKRHCQFRLKQTAVGALALACREDAVFSWEGDLLTVTVDTIRTVIDSQTGRLVKQDDTDFDAGSLMPTSVELDEFNRQLHDIQTAGCDFPNDADGNRPLSCVLEYAARELEFWDVNGQWKEMTGALRKVLAAGALARFDKWLAPPPPATDDESFRIPGELIVLESVHTISEFAKVNACEWGIEMGDRLAPRHSWLWTLWREAMFLSAKMPSRLDKPTEYLIASRAGAIECWIVAALLDAFGRDADARRCAVVGRERIKAAAFRSEYEALLPTGYWSGDLLLHLALTLRELTEDEAIALASVTMLSGLGDEAMLDSAASITEFLHKRGDEPVADVLPDALDLLWHHGLRQGLKDALSELAQKPKSKVELQTLIDQIEVAPLK